MSLSKKVILAFSIAACLLAYAVKTAAEEPHSGKQASNKKQPVKLKTADNKKRTIKQGHKVPGLATASYGKKLYNQYQCYDCHTIQGKGCAEGFRLDGVGSRRTKSFIREHLIDPEKHVENNPNAFGSDLNLMPPQNLDRAEIDNLVEYLHTLK